MGKKQFLMVVGPGRNGNAFETGILVGLILDGVYGLQ
jgi:hypothetical protein